jgi:anti-sigma B factor antagonist
MSAPLRTVVTARGDRLRVAVHGEVDLISATALFEALDEAINRAPARIDIDLSDVAFLDSAGVDALVKAQRAARHLESSGGHRCTLRITEASRPAAVALRAAGVHGYLDIIDRGGLIAV